MVENETLKKKVNELTRALGKDYGGGKWTFKAEADWWEPKASRASGGAS